MHIELNGLVSRACMFRLVLSVQIVIILEVMSTEKKLHCQSKYVLWWISTEFCFFFDLASKLHVLLLKCRFLRKKNKRWNAICTGGRISGTPTVSAVVAAELCKRCIPRQTRNQIPRLVLIARKMRADGVSPRTRRGGDGAGSYERGRGRDSQPEGGRPRAHIARERQYNVSDWFNRTNCLIKDLSHPWKRPPPTSVLSPSSPFNVFFLL